MAIIAFKQPWYCSPPPPFLQQDQVDRTLRWDQLGLSDPQGRPLHEAQACQPLPKAQREHEQCTSLSGSTDFLLEEKKTKT